MNKSELIKAMAEKTGLSQKDAGLAYEAFVETITEALQEGDKVQLIGFGSFEIKDVPAKMGINPQTGAKVAIPESKKPVLKFGKAFKELF